MTIKTIYAFEFRPASQDDGGIGGFEWDTNALELEARAKKMMGDRHDYDTEYLSYSFAFDPELDVNDKEFMEQWVGDQIDQIPDPEPDSRRYRLVRATERDDSFIEPEPIHTYHLELSIQFGNAEMLSLADARVAIMRTIEEWKHDDTEVAENESWEWNREFRAHTILDANGQGVGQVILKQVLR